MKTRLANNDGMINAMPIRVSFQLYVNITTTIATMTTKLLMNIATDVLSPSCTT